MKLSSWISICGMLCALMHLHDPARYRLLFRDRFVDCHDFFACTSIMCSAPDEPEGAQGIPAFWSFKFRTNRINPSEAFLAVVLMMACADPLPENLGDSRGFDIIELYAGRARISRMGRAAGLRCITADMIYDSLWSVHKSSLNLNGSAGFAPLGRNRQGFTSAKFRAFFGLHGVVWQ